MQSLSSWSEKSTILFLVGSVGSFWLAFYLLWRGFFWTDEGIHFGQIIFSFPFWLIGVAGFFMFVRSPYFSELEKKCAIYFLYSSLGVLFFWFLFISLSPIDAGNIPRFQ